MNDFSCIEQGNISWRDKFSFLAHRQFNYRVQHLELFNKTSRFQSLLITIPPEKTWCENFINPLSVNPTK